MRHFLCFLPLLALLTMAACTSPAYPLLGNPELPYPPNRPPVVGDILHLPTGHFVTEDQMLAAVSDARLVYVGETHDNPASHRLELTVLTALADRYPGQVALGLEMFTPEQQPVLDAWVAGLLTEKEFLKQSDWNRVWRMDFAYYRELLHFARDRKIPVRGLNADKELVKAIGRQSPEDLAPELQARLPELDLSDPYQTALVTGIYGGHSAGDGMLDGFQRVQTLWDEAMAGNIAAFLGAPERQDWRMVVVAGGNHVRGGFGIPRRVFRRLPASYVLVGSKEIEVPAELQDRMMDVTIPPFPMPPYHYLVHTRYETLPPQVKLGIMLNDEAGTVTVEGVIPGSIAAAAGVLKGDHVVSLNGEAIGESFDLVYLVRQQRPGDPGTLVVERDGQELTFAITFQEMSDAAHHQQLKQ
jgi:uncharacterized iron-regulated protein